MPSRRPSGPRRSGSCPRRSKSNQSGATRHPHKKGQRKLVCFSIIHIYIYIISTVCCESTVLSQSSTADVPQVMGALARGDIMADKGGGSTNPGSTSSGVVAVTVLAQAEPRQGEGEGRPHPPATASSAVPAWDSNYRNMEQGIRPWRRCHNCGEHTYVNKWYWGSSYVASATIVDVRSLCSHTGSPRFPRTQWCVMSSAGG